jgi:hypothetical protein
MDRITKIDRIAKIDRIVRIDRTVRTARIARKASVRYHCGGWPEEVNTFFLNSYMVYL